MSGLQLEYSNERCRSRPTRAGLPQIVPSLAHHDAVFCDVQLSGGLCRQRAVLAGQGALGGFAPALHGFAARRLGLPYDRAGDAGKQIFGLAISPTSLAMKLRPTPAIQFLQLVQPALALIVVVSLLFLLLHWQRPSLLLPLTLIGVALVVMLGNDATLLGGVRPFDDGNDGLVYDSWSRTMAQQLLDGDVERALEGLETGVLFHAGLELSAHGGAPDLRRDVFWLRLVAAAAAVPGVLPVPAILFTARTAIAVTLIFIAIPIGAAVRLNVLHLRQACAQVSGDSAAAISFSLPGSLD